LFLRYGSDKAAIRQQRPESLRTNVSLASFLPLFASALPAELLHLLLAKTASTSSILHHASFAFGGIRSLADQSSSVACYTAPPADGVNP
jgi:hypothetical protein